MHAQETTKITDEDDVSADKKDASANAGRPRSETSLLIVKLASALTYLDPGSLAEIRRPAPPHGSASFWRLYHGLGLTGQPSWWETPIQALAIMTGGGDAGARKSAHDGAVPLGRALQQAGLSDGRLARMLTATPTSRRGGLVRIARMLAAKGIAADARQLVGAMRPDAEPTLRRIADDYYAAQFAETKTSTKTTA